MKEGGVAGKATAVVTVTERVGRDSRDAEIVASSLEALYEACRRAEPGALVRVQIHGEAGEVRLNFASFIHSKR
jgi:hypothetical protein